MKKFELKDAIEIGKELDINFEVVGFTAKEFLAGLHVELEHGLVDSKTNVSNDNILVTAKIVLAHLNENKMYYDPNIGVEAWEHALDKFEGDTNGKKIIIV